MVEHLCRKMQMAFDGASSKGMLEHMRFPHLVGAVFEGSFENLRGRETRSHQGAAEATLICRDESLVQFFNIRPKSIDYLSLTIAVRGVLQLLAKSGLVCVC